MMNFLFKTGTYLFIWKKFKTQIISIIASTFLIWLIFGIYDDLIKIFKLENTSTLLYLLLGKWLIVSFIILYNILLIKSIKSPSKDEIIENEEIILPKKSQEILDKKDILTTTDLILKKYRNNNDDNL
ncbi:hypothetical protein N5T95_10025 [Aliarcobacter cryaerophilus]|uniref:hypothetical protein n=1 Tax=Aliarcobacter cryaerophilus TaxID=28198 RepID=UPI0021B5C012|nr:hypothetical protein [Aliarcobacter cryaerophilus]MCT7535852.1 hypothetical protein [Aliarcobacter cryaerophilus]